MSVQHWISDASGYLCGPSPCIADLVAIAELETVELLSPDYSKFNKFSSWRERMRQRDSFRVIHHSLTTMRQRICKA